MTPSTQTESDGWQPRPGEMHPVDQAFHDIAIKERDYERVKCDRLEAEIVNLRRRVRAVISEWRDYPESYPRKAFADDVAKALDG